MVDLTKSAQMLKLAKLAAKYGGPELAESLGLEKPKTEIDRASRAEALARDLETIGPTYVKFGQILASRPDLVSVHVNRLIGPSTSTSVEQVTIQHS